MIFIFSLVVSVLIFIMQFVSLSAEYAVLLKKFTYAKQRLVSVLFNALFLITILAVGICFSEYDGVCALLCIVQLCFNVIYVSVLRAVGLKKFRQHVIDEILRLNIDITEDPVVIRRKLISDSETSYSVQDVEMAVTAISKNQNNNINNVKK